jgi:hypothetical protein
MYPFSKSRYGFTMLPLVMFMFVIVGLISAGYMMLGPKVQLGKAVETKAGLEKAVDAIISWSVANGKLPDTSQYQAILPSPNDSWSKPFVYLYENTLANPASGGICGRTTTSYPAGCTDEATCNAFMLISGGDDYTINSTPATSLFFPASAILDNRDLSRIVTLAELKNRAGCYGSTQGRLRILNNELPNADGCSSSYAAQLYPDGGVKRTAPLTPIPYKWSTTTPNWSINSSSGLLSTTLPADSVTVTLTDAMLDIQRHYFLKVKPCGSWNFNAGTGNTIGSGSTLGTIAGTATWVPRAGGFSLYLNGTNNYIYFNDINYYNIGTGNVALAAWVNFSGMPKQSWCDPASKVDMAIGAIAGKGFLYPAIGYGMYVTQTRQCTSCTSGCGAWSNYKVVFQLRNPANTDIHTVSSDDAISGGSWIHVAAMLDRSASPATDQIKLYLNGVKQTVATNDYQYTAPTALNFDNSFKFTIGARHGGGSSYAFPYWGPIDDVQFYKVALTDGQVQTLYTTTALPYRIWNNSGVPRWYTYYDGTTTTPCSAVSVASGVEFPPLLVKGTLATYSNSACTNSPLTISYVTAVDTNGDNCLNSDQTDRSCP